MWESHFDQSITQDSFIKGREPCPFRIVDDCGGAFSMGIVFGSAWNFCKGCFQAPRTLGTRTILRYGVDLVKLRGPVLGGNFGVWGLTFSTIECLLVYYRRRDDWFNSVTSGGVAGAVLAVRGGRNAMFRSGMVGAVLLGLIELAQYWFMKSTAQMQQSMKHMEIPAPPVKGTAIHTRQTVKHELNIVPDLRRRDFA
eukprot:EG_transcript_19555